ncbi:MAG: Rnase Y domain-containing protein, partial [Candidatus Moranbacteria bacterium]|nr:Rnase Y domain-containing protein [Candidatus Moranbacteria bacterium]
MEINLAFIAIGMIMLTLGAVAGYYTRQSIARKQLSTAEGKANSILEEANQKYKEETLEAKKKAVKILEEAKKKEEERENQIRQMEKRLERREEMLDKKMEELDKGRDLLEKKVVDVKKIRKEAESIKNKEMARLEKIAGLSKDQAKKVLLQLTEENCKSDLVERIKKMENQGADELKKKAQGIIAQA